MAKKKNEHTSSAHTEETKRPSVRTAEQTKAVEPESLTVTFDGNMWNVHDERDALRFSDTSRKVATEKALNLANGCTVTVYRKDGTVRS